MTFCSCCGKELNKTDLFCPTCGTKSESQNEVRKTVNKKERLPLPFSDFKASREKERAKHFCRSTKKSKRKLVSNEDLNETVKINVGIMLYDGQELKSQRGKSLLLSLKKSANTDDLLNAALNKHKAHSKNLIKPNAKYVMIYPDGSKVAKLKETDEDFVLHKYKMECNKPYHRITFFLCQEFDHSMASLQRCLFDDSSSDDLSKNDELAEEESLPKSRRLSDKDNLPFDIDIPSTSPAETWLPVNLSTGNASGSRNIVPFSATENSLADSQSSNNSNCQVNYNTLCDMFPQVDDHKIQEALGSSSGNIEVAVTVSHILEITTLQTTPQQVYASFDFCNNVDNDEEFKECDYDASEATENETGAEIEEPVAVIIKKFAEDKLNNDCTLRIKVINMLMIAVF